MKTGRSLTEIAKELERQKDTRRDFVAPSAALSLAVVDVEVGGSRPGEETDSASAGERAPIQRLALRGLPSGDAGVTDYAHGQIAAHVEIPERYYNRML